MTEKLTPEDIKRALECCADLYDCTDCPCKDFCGDLGILEQNALDLINSQQAEIERLEKELSTATNHITRLENQIERLLPMLKIKRAEAIKEFAGKIADVFCSHDKGDAYVREVVYNLVKEMAGEQE